MQGGMQRGLLLVTCKLGYQPIQNNKIGVLVREKFQEKHSTQSLMIQEHKTAKFFKHMHTVNHVQTTDHVLTIDLKLITNHISI